MSNRVDSNSRTILNRRSFLGLGAVATAAALVPGRAQAAVSSAPAKRDRTLSFFHTHTGERLKLAYCCDGEYQPEALAQLNHLLRDFRVNEEKPIDPQLFDLLHELGGTLETDQPYHIISGYRSPRPTRCCASAAAAIPASPARACTWWGRPSTSAFPA